MREMQSLLKLSQVTNPAVIKVTTTSSTIDMAQYDACTVLFIFGAYTDGTHTFSLQDSPDNSTYTAVAAANVIGTIPVVSDNTQQNTIKTVAYIGGQRYLQVVNTVSGSPVTGMLYGIAAVLGYPEKMT